jgi:hypothetical protein
VTSSRVPAGVQQLDGSRRPCSAASSTSVAGRMAPARCRCRCALGSCRGHAPPVHPVRRPAHHAGIVSYARRGRGSATLRPP